MRKPILTSRGGIRLFLFLCAILFAIDSSSVAASKGLSHLFREIVKFSLLEFGKQLVQKSGSTSSISDVPYHQQKLDRMERLVPGYRQTAEALARCARDEREAREMGTALANEVIYMMHRKGINRGTFLACPECGGPIRLAEEDASIYSDRASVRQALDRLMKYHGRNGEQRWKLRTRHEITMNRVVRTLADALELVRSCNDVNEDGFNEAVIDASYRAALKASGRGRLWKSVSLRDSGKMLAFEMNDDFSKVASMEFDVAMYVERLKHLMVFVGDEAGNTAILLKRDDQSSEAVEARRMKSVELTEQCTNVGESNIDQFPKVWPPKPVWPPQCGSGLRRSDIEAVNKQFLLERLGKVCS